MRHPLARRSNDRMAAAGLVVGPMAWMANQFLGYALVSWECASRSKGTLALGLLCALGSAAGAWLSSRVLISDPAPMDLDDPRAGRSPQLLALTGTGAGTLFAVLVVLQSLALLVFSGCER
jgi:hypothetical protein